MSILGRKVSKKAVAAVAAILVAVVGLLPVMTMGRTTREITLVAKNMAFYLEGDLNTPNPVIEVKAGETVRIVLRNRDRGFTHDFAVPALKAATGLVDWNEEETIRLKAPRQPGTYEYVCKPHLLMMRGTLKVIGD